MNISYQWLQDYITQDLPEPDELADILTMQAYEVEEIKKVGDDYVFDIDVLPNRAADSLSHIGVAREVATLLNVNLDTTEYKPETSNDIETDKLVNLAVGSPNVRRATKRVVSDINVRESPEFTQKRLQAVGQTPINNVVDITNYAMLETGQPVHAFDYDKLAGDEPKEIVIREAQDGEMITTLDENQYELEEGMLVIADKEKPLDIAGIKGGLNSHIDQSTKRVLLSVCSFDPATVRKASQKLNLRTDALKRFENNISPETVIRAMERLSELIASYADGQVAEGIVDVYPRQANQYVTGVTTDQVNQILGTDMSRKETKKILERTHCDVDVVDPTEEVLDHVRDYEGVEYERGASVSFDAPDKFDCSSFTSFLFAQFGGVSIPRISVDQFMYGQPVEKDNIHPGDLVFYNTGERIIYYETQEFIPGTPVADGIDHPAIYLGDGKVISATSYTGEVSVTDIDNPEFGEQIGIRRMAEGKRLRVHVPHWRQDLRQPEDLIEEVGRVYGYENIEKTEPNPTTDNPKVHKTFYYVQKIRDILEEAGLSEVYTYAFQDSGDVEIKNPIAEDKTYLRSSLKSGLKQALKDNKKHKELLDGTHVDIFEIGNVFSGQKETLQLGLGTTGDKTRIENSVAIIEDELGVAIESSDKMWSEKNILLIDFESLFEGLTAPDDYSQLKDLQKNVTYQPPSSYPYVLRDIAMWVPDKIKSQKSKVKNTIQDAAGSLLVNVKLFDQYDPDDQDRVSLAYRLVFQSGERTLEDEEVNEIMDDVHDTAVREGWEVR